MFVQALNRLFAEDGSEKATSEYAGRAKQHCAGAWGNRRSAGRPWASEQHCASGSATKNAAYLAAIQVRFGESGAIGVALREMPLHVLLREMVVQQYAAKL